MYILKPPRLNPGDTIGVLALSSPLLPAHQTAYEQGNHLLRKMGFDLREGNTLGLVRGWAAGTPQEQADDLHHMLADSNVKAIIALSGGFSTMSVLDYIDYDLVRTHPKPLLGYSDITIYHLALFARCGLIGFHADTLLSGPGDTWSSLTSIRQAYLLNLYRHLLTSDTPIGTIEPSQRWECWRPGQATGHLIGGDLKRITELAATPFFPQLAVFDEAILFWEEIGEYIWDVAINLTILRHMGVFERIAGMVIGTLTWINQDSTMGYTFPTVRDMVLDITTGYAFPIIANMDFGHHTANIPMPIGVMATFNAEHLSFAFIDAAVT